MSEFSDYFFASLKMHITGCNDPMIALRNAVEDCAFVYMDVDPYAGHRRAEPDWPILLRGL